MGRERRIQGEASSVLAMFRANLWMSPQSLPPLIPLAAVDQLAASTQGLRGHLPARWRLTSPRRQAPGPSLPPTQHLSQPNSPLPRYEMYKYSTHCTTHPVLNIRQCCVTGFQRRQPAGIAG
ncbi:hypothetical protein L209DRAFT_423944 [Thermothelomyces heterothallicus CBS 203.75]